MAYNSLVQFVFVMISNQLFLSFFIYRSARRGNRIRIFSIVGQIVMYLSPRQSCIFFFGSEYLQESLQVHRWCRYTPCKQYVEEMNRFRSKLTNSFFLKVLAPPWYIFRHWPHHIYYVLTWLFYVCFIQSILSFLRFAKYNNS